jgi:hypothetical protein
MTSAKPLSILVNYMCSYSFCSWYLIGAAVQGGWDNNADTSPTNV